METVRARVTTLVGRVKLHTSLEDAVPAIRQYPDADLERRRKMEKAGYHWDTPKFESPIEQRRLRLLNSLFTAALRIGFPPSVRGAEARDLSLKVGEQHVAFAVEPVGGSPMRQSDARPSRKDVTGLHVAISRRDGSGTPVRQWRDTKDAHVDRVLSDILVELLVTGEQFHRDSAMFRYRWILERRER